MNQPSAPIGAHVPPHDLEAEEHLLGALMLPRCPVEAVTEAVGTDDFYRPEFGTIFTVAVEMFERGDPVEPLTVAAELEARGVLAQVGGRARIHQLATIVPAALNAPHYARIVRDLAARRREHAVGRALTVAAGNGGLNASPEVRDQLAALLGGAGLAREQVTPLDLTAALSGSLPEVRWLWQGWLARGDLGLLVGDPGVGKSLLTLAIASGLRDGGQVLDAPCSTGRVGILDYENPLDEAVKRLLAFGYSADDHAGIVYFHSPPINLTAADGIASLAGLIERYDLDLLVIDSLRRAAPGLDENDSGAVSSVFSPLRRLTAASGRTILVVAHARKRSGEGTAEASQMVRGSGDLVASADTLLYVRSKERGAFTLEQGKARRGVPQPPQTVRITETDDGRLSLAGGAAVAAEASKIEETLARVTELLRESGPLDRPVLTSKLGLKPRNSTLTRALKLGVTSGWLVKQEGATVGAPTRYALAAGAPE